MAKTWWQRLGSRKSQVPNADSQNQTSICHSGFEFWDLPPSGWWLRAECRPVRAGIMAAAKPAPLMLTACTYNIPQPEERPMSRGVERLARLRELGMKFAA